MPREQILNALAAWIKQRPGLEFGNYGEMKSYRAELRQIAKDRRDAETLLRAVALRPSITADDLIAATRAYSGRLTIGETRVCPKCHKDPTLQHNHEPRVVISYCEGQYFPTEYRKAVCAVLASALWDYFRDKWMPKPNGKITVGHGKGPFYHESEHDNIDGKTPGDWLRWTARREFGRSIAQRWFN